MVVAENSAATRAFIPDEKIVHEMVDSSILKYTGKKSVALAWATVASTQDVVGLKIYSAPGTLSGTRPVVVAAVVEGLLAAGIPPQHIILWDRHLGDLQAAGYQDMARRYKIRLAGAVETGFDEKAFYESSIIGNLIFGDLEFEKKGDTVGRKSFVTKILSREVTRIISITPLLNHNLAGVTGHICSLALGGVDNIMRFELEPGRLATALPEIFALAQISDHVALNITDALIAQYEGEQRSLLHYSSPLNQIWMSKDPVALDAMGIEELERQRLAARAPQPKPRLEIYQNATVLELGTSDTKKLDIELVR